MGPEFHEKWSLWVGPGSGVQPWAGLDEGRAAPPAPPSPAQGCNPHATHQCDQWDDAEGWRDFAARQRAKAVHKRGHPTTAPPAPVLSKGAGPVVGCPVLSEKGTSYFSPRHQPHSSYFAKVLGERPGDGVALPQQAVPAGAAQDKAGPPQGKAGTPPEDAKVNMWHDYGSYQDGKGGSSVAYDGAGAGKGYYDGRASAYDPAAIAVADHKAHCYDVGKGRWAPVGHDYAKGSFYDDVKGRSF